MDESFEPIPEDLHPAICYAVWDIGTQFSERFERSAHKVIIGWELPLCRGEFERDGKKVNLPRNIYKKYTLSLHKKADLRKDLESWRGKKFSEEELKGFDLKHLLGAPCQIQVLHNRVDNKVYSNITAIIKSPNTGKTVPEQSFQFFSFEEQMDIPPETPRWIKALIQQSNEAKGIAPGDTSSDPYPDDVPF